MNYIHYWMSGLSRLKELPDTHPAHTFQQHKAKLLYYFTRVKNMKNLIKIFLSCILSIGSLVQATESLQSASPQGASAYIISPNNGETVGEQVTIKFGLKEMGIAPAGFDKANTGHHHLIIDGECLPALDQPLGGNVIHFGGGQTETTIKLSKGKHTLQLILGNHLHIPHNPPVVSDKITITVE